MPSTPPPPLSARRGRKPKPRAVELRITIAEIEPPIWRRVRVPDAYTLHQLHRVIQLAFGRTAFKFNPAQRLRALFGWSSTYRG